MDLVGEADSAAAFHRWAARTVLSHRTSISDLVRRGEAGEPLGEHDFLPARFSVDGEWQQDGWPNFQLDGYGHWLWSLGQHLRLSGDRVDDEIHDAAELIAGYLATFWQEPCYDAWEEYRSQLHTSTLASIYGGLASLGDTLLPSMQPVAQAVRDVILTECVKDGRFVKHIENPAVDASLLWVSQPFGVVVNDHPVMRATVQEIERILAPSGGVKRYAADTFYGGGEWLLLTAWLGWHHVRVGNLERARLCLDWIESHRAADGSLPEQVKGESSNERFLNYWTRRWGPPAKPLLWSHAMALTLRVELGDLKG